MNIIIFGPPGAGKGTQAENLVKDYNLFSVSAGNLLRKEINDDSEIGREIKSIIDKGSLVSDEIINNLIDKVLSDRKKSNNILFDGYPRNLNQAKNLDNLLNKKKIKLSCVLSLTVDKETVVKRIVGRQICNNCGIIFNEYFNPANITNHNCDPKFLIKRSDDNKEVVFERYDTYVKKTLPVLNFYEEKKILYKINGIRGIDQIYKEICSIISSLET